MSVKHPFYLRVSTGLHASSSQYISLCLVTKSYKVYIINFPVICDSFTLNSDTYEHKNACSHSKDSARGHCETEEKEYLLAIVNAYRRRIEYR